MGIIVSGNWGKALWPGVNAFWGRYYPEYSPEWVNDFDQFTSRKQYEEDVGTVTFGLAYASAEGKPVQFVSDSQSFITRYTHTEFKLGYMITRIMMEDDLYDVASEKRTKQLAFSMHQTKEIEGASVYNNAFDSAYPIGDGVALISASHPNKSGGTFSNTLGTAADISEAALEQAMIDIGKFRNDIGHRIKVTPQSLHGPIDLQFEFERILKNTNRPATADRDINALVSKGFLPKGYFINHYYSDTDAWFIRTDCPDGMKHWTRRPMEFAMDNDFDTDNAKFKATERYSFGATDPRAIYGSPGA